MIDRVAREALIDSLEAGDLANLNGTLRVVRDVSRGMGPKRGRPRRLCSPDRVRCVCFAILRCSWTGQPYTVKGRSDLYTADLSIVRKGYGLTHGPLEVMLQKQIEDHRAPKLLECCDVIGVVT